MMSSKKQLLFIVLLILVGIEILYWQFIIERKPTSVTIAVSESPVYAHFFVAQSLGYFRNEQLDVTLKVNSIGTTSLSDLETGAVQLAAALQTPIVLNIYDGKDLLILSTLHRSASGSAVIVSKESGINSIRDLPGKRIAAVKGSTSEYILALLLQSEGLYASTVEIVEITGDVAIESLKSGIVDGIATLNSSLNRVERRMEGNYTKIPVDVYTQVSLLVGNKAYVVKNEKTISRVIKALIKAEEYITKNPTEALEITKTWLPNLESEDISINWRTNQYTMRLDNKLLTFLNREASYFNNSGLFSSKLPRLREYVFPEYLRKIKPDAVTVY